ncbi:GTP 3',8-cyclase MoaA [Microbacterium pseudoresistens]|uniref:GTP 3',8-cyclase n=1 Tax=Microbacterium pseudoresistens TaxID=640634 RepID=A0A7Y9EVQ9_9MICO|nr:GTP 3',8-cyclase MoaA [Microbacterium pseudoresistens]NYD54691.1 cyclic pyranopterin phosphate synthase [Microbacterium pseudoresistens]
MTISPVHAPPRTPRRDQRIRGDGARRLPSTGLLLDRRERPLRDLRISVTDRCNFRCSYCMPKAIFGRDYAFLEHDQLLSFDEIERIARIAVDSGVHKLRLTGGEPLLRRGIEELVARLSALRAPDGTRPEIALTTNGSALNVKAQALRDAGLDRLTVSLDSLDDALFQRMNDVRFPVSRVLAGIDAAMAAGFDGVKLNMVVKRGLNDHEILPMASHFKDTPHTLRFIEFMDVGTSNGWRMEDVVPSAEVVERISAVHPLEPLEPATLGETAQRWRYADGGGEIGVISSVTRAFCSTCNRARISTDGKLFTCLFADEGHDLRALLRSGADDETIADALAGIWAARDDRYSEIRTNLTPELRAARKRIEMSYIGG